MADHSGTGSYGEHSFESAGASSKVLTMVKYMSFSLSSPTGKPKCETQVCRFAENCKFQLAAKNVLDHIHARTHIHIADGRDEPRCFKMGAQRCEQMAGVTGPECTCQSVQGQ